MSMISSCYSDMISRFMNNDKSPPMFVESFVRFDNRQEDEDEISRAMG